MSTHTHAHMHTCTHARGHAPSHVCTDAHIRTRMQHQYTHALTCAHMHACRHACIDAREHAHMHTCTHTQMHDARTCISACGSALLWSGTVSDAHDVWLLKYDLGLHWCAMVDRYAARSRSRYVCSHGMAWHVHLVGGVAF